MVFENNAADGIDLRERHKPFRHSRMHFRLPARSIHGRVESLLLIVTGLLGGFGLGLAFAMWLLFA